MSLNLVRMRGKINVLYHLIRDCDIIILFNIQNILPHIITFK